MTTATDKEKHEATMIRIDCPGLVVVSEANTRCHWTVRRKRQRLQSDLLRVGILAGNFYYPAQCLPLTITFTRHGGKRMDCDNLAGAFKAVRDSLAKWLRRDDGDPLLTWRYEQRGGTRGITVEISES
jgi:hypothetical protein